MHIIFSKSVQGKNTREKIHFRYAAITKIQQDKKYMDSTYNTLKRLLIQENLVENNLYEEVEKIIEYMFLENVPLTYIQEFISKIKNKHELLNQFFHNYKEYGQQGFHMIGLSLLK